MNEIFRRFSKATSDTTGSSWAFMTAVAVIVVWATSGPVFGFSDTWQLVINTATTIVTFLMVFLIQNTQNRDSKALHLKLDELLRAVEGAHTSMVDLEDLSDKQLTNLQDQFQQLREIELKNDPGDALALKELEHAEQELKDAREDLKAVQTAHRNGR